MSFPSHLIDEFGDLDQDIYSPETFAWKLLLDDTKSDKLSSMLQTFTDIKDQEDDPVSFFFEIVLTILLELIFGIMKLDHYAENSADTEFIPNYDLDQMIPTLKQKFNELHLILFMTVIENIEDNELYI